MNYSLARVVTSTRSSRSCSAEQLAIGSSRAQNSPRPSQDCRLWPSGGWPRSTRSWPRRSSASQPDVQPHLWLLNIYTVPFLDGSLVYAVLRRKGLQASSATSLTRLSGRQEPPPGAPSGPWPVSGYTSSRASGSRPPGAAGPPVRPPRRGHPREQRRRGDPGQVGRIVESDHPSRAWLRTRAGSLRLSATSRSKNPGGGGHGRCSTGISHEVHGYRVLQGPASTPGPPRAPDWPADTGAR